MRNIAIVGGSLAGLSAAEALRDSGFSGNVTIVGDEPLPPYDRPPLSKQFLAGTWDIERVHLRPQAHLDGLELDWRLGTRAVSVDPRADRVHLSDGGSVSFDGLLIATGSRPRTIAGTAGLDGVHTLRTLEDSIRLRDELGRSPTVVVVGSGFIGAEVAATCHGLGLDVTVVEAAPTPLARVLGPAMGSVCAALHADNGVRVLYGNGVRGFAGTGRVEQVVLDDDTRIDADLVVVGIGAAPVTDWLEGSGIEVSDGVVCDATCASVSRPNVVAAGDVARWHNELFDTDMRVEHWDNAVAQGRAAAQRLLRGPGAETFAPVPYFWSDQYDAKIHFAGRLGERCQVVEGSTAERRFTALFGTGDRLVGVLGIGRPGPVNRFRRLIAASTTWDEALRQAAA